MKSRGLAILWLIIGVALWNGIFDLYVSRGAREYLQLRAESELGLAPVPSMPEVMGQSQHAGLIAASIWAGIVVAFGWITTAVARKQ